MIFLIRYFDSKSPNINVDKEYTVLFEGLLAAVPQSGVDSGK
jgi:hypothetical protein